MKFLPPGAEGKELYPINFIYDEGDERNPDILYCVYKDVTTNQKFVETIEKPMIEIYIVKEEFRGTKVNGSFLHDWIEKDYVETRIVRYKTRKHAAAKILNIPYEQIMTCPYVLGLDVNVRNFYFQNFLMEYPNDNYKNIHLAFSDIESDVKGRMGKIDVEGNCPINLISYIDGFYKQIYLFALYRPNYGKIDYFVEHLDDFKKECIEEFMPDYGEFEYNVLVFNSEIQMLKAYWEVVRTLQPDFMLFWNMPYDMSNLICRPRVLGHSSENIICDDRFKTKLINFKEDPNSILHKKRHVCDISIATVIACQMWLYAGVRSAGPKLPSTKLKVIGKKETGNTKIDLSEAGGIENAPYEDFWTFAKYNIADSLLQFKIDEVTKDTQDMYTRMYDNALLVNEIFASTNMWANYLGMELKSKYNRILCNNRNKVQNSDNSFIDDNINFIYDEDDYEDFDTDDEIDAVADNIAESQKTEDADGKRKKFSGAIVLNPERMSPSGHKVHGTNAKYIHDDVIDEDITSEYPTAITITNVSNETFVGKLVLDNPYDIKLPMYDYTFVSDEEEKYKVNPAALFLESVAQGDILPAANIWLNLPSIDELDSLIPEESILLK